MFQLSKAFRSETAGRASKADGERCQSMQVMQARSCEHECLTLTTSACLVACSRLHWLGACVCVDHSSAVSSDHDAATRHARTVQVRRSFIALCLSVCLSVCYTDRRVVRFSASLLSYSKLSLPSRQYCRVLVSAFISLRNIASSMRWCYINNLYVSGIIITASVSKSRRNTMKSCFLEKEFKGILILFYTLSLHI